VFRDLAKAVKHKLQKLQITKACATDKKLRLLW